MSSEIELKFAVDGESAFDALVRHLELPAREFHRSVLQVNHFFDTPAFALHDQKVTLRLREENRRHILTLKGRELRRSDDGVATERLEVEVRLAPEIALDVLQGIVSPRDALAQRIANQNPEALETLDAAIGSSELHYVGRFENVRTLLSPVNVEVSGSQVELTFALDSTTLSPTRVDHEIEVEVGPEVDLEELRRQLVAMLAAAGIGWRPAKSKSHRFFDLVRG